MSTDPPPAEPHGRRRLSVPALVGWIAVFYLVPQVVSLFAVPGVSDGPPFVDVRSALQLELLPDLGSAIIAAVLVWRLGWVDVVSRERVVTNRWVVIVPGSMLVASIAAVDYRNLAAAGVALVATLVVSTLFTGISEELMFRGVALQTMRDRSGEVSAAWTSSAMFGLLHLPNIIVSGGGAVFQAVWAIGVGYLLYLCRRVGRGIALAIVVHWWWDLSTFSAVLGREEAPVLGDLQFAMFLVSLVLMAVVVVRRRAIPSSPRAVG